MERDTKPTLISPICLVSNADKPGSVVSANGRFVAFELFFNIVPDSNNGRNDIFHRDLQTGVTKLVSVNLSGTGGGNGDSQNPAISADGRYVAFESLASNLVALDTTTQSDVFVYDAQTSVTTLVSVNSEGTGSGNLGSVKPTISANGRVVAFQSSASNLSSIDANNFDDIFTRDLQTGTTSLVSCNATCSASGNGNSFMSNVPKDKAPRANIRMITSYRLESRATDLVNSYGSNGFTEVLRAIYRLEQPRS